MYALTDHGAERMRTWNVLAAITSAASLAACNQMASPPSPTSSSAPPSVTAQLTALSKRMDGIDDQLKKMDTTLTLDDLQITALQSPHGSANFDPTDSRFQRIDSDLASFAVSIVDVAAYGDGVRIKLNLGNPMAAGVGGVTLHMKYGPRQPVSSNESGVYPKWWAQLKSKDVDLPSNLKGASWNPTTVVLPGIDPKDFGYLQLSIDTKTIFLATG